MAAEAGKRNTSSAFGFSTDDDIDLVVDKRTETSRQRTTCEFF